MKRAGIYVRVSTQEQKLHGISIDNQEDALRRYCADNNYTVVDVYNDAGLTASEQLSHRIELLRLLDDCKKGKIDIILFTRLDRWFRSVPDYYTVQAVLDEAKVVWRTIWEDYETETSSGKFKVNIMLSIAQAESDRTKEKVKSVMDYKRQKGEYVGRPPLGYIVKDKKLVKDDPRAEGITAFYQTYLKTYSPQKSIDAAASFGINIAYVTATKMLRKKVYAGVVNEYLSCEPYITMDEFNTIQRHLDSTPRKTKFGKAYIFSGLVRCHCGARMSATSTIDHRKRKGDLEKNFYKCFKFRNMDVVDRHKTSIYEQRLERYMLSNIERIIDEYNASISLENLIKENKIKEKQKEKLEQKLKRIGIRFEDGDIGVEEYRQKRDAIMREIASIVFIPNASPVSLPDNWKGIYDTLDPAHKQRFWRQIIDFIVILPDRTIEVHFK